MKRYELTSALAGDIDAYIDFKRDCGLESVYRNWLMSKLDDYCSRNGATRLDRATVEGFIEERIERAAPESFGWICYIRDLTKWAFLSGREGVWVIPDGTYRTHGPRSIPYLVTAAEADAFFSAIPGIRFKGAWGWQAACYFGLMHSCGLRPGEVRRLSAEDVDLARGRLLVRRSKWGRSRSLPVTEEVTCMLAECGARTSARFGAERPTFFVSTTGRPIIENMPQAMFRRIWEAAGLPIPGSDPKPRPYCFRHRFAYANIERWLAEGRNVDSMMPYLAKYMGHASVESTYYYVHTSPDFVASFADVTRGAASPFPEVGFNG